MPVIALSKLIFISLLNFSLNVFLSSFIKSDLSKGSASNISPEMFILFVFFTKKSLFIFPFLKVLISNAFKSLVSKFLFNLRSVISIFVFPDKKTIFVILNCLFGTKLKLKSISDFFPPSFI